MDVERLLTSLRENGTIDSEGEFTVDLLEARRKMAKYRSSNHARYLLCIVSAGLAAGGRCLKVESSQGTLGVVIPGAFLNESDLSLAYSGRPQEGLSGAALDLALGIHLAFQANCKSLELRASPSAHDGYLWNVGPDSLESEALPCQGEASLSLKFSMPESWKQRLPKFLRFLGGYAGQVEEVRLLEQYCDGSFVPITVNGESVDRPLLLPAGSVNALVGEPPKECSEFNPRFRFHPNDWDGYLVLCPGTIKIVHFGVTVQELKSPSLTGVVRHDKMERDLSREGVLQDSVYEAFLGELEQYRITMLKEFGTHLAEKSEAEVRPLLEELVGFALSPEGQETRRFIGAWMSKELGRLNLDSRRRHRDYSVLEFVTLYRRLQGDVYGIRGLSQAKFIFHTCAQALKAGSPQVDQLLNESADLIMKYYPKDLLAAGYCLLGLGACLRRFGQPGAASMTWSEAVETVEKLNDPNAVALIQAHLNHEPEHMMQEVSKALTIYAKSKSG